MTSYYDHDGITLYCGDAREVLHALPAVDSIITDPVWPNCLPVLAGSDDPFGLLLATLNAAPPAKRLAVQLGIDSDPRFLAAVPRSWPFFRACWLDVSRPHYSGRVLNGANLAYLFGQAPPVRPGARLIPGMYRDADNTGKVAGHPCARKLGHAEFLVRWWSEPGGLVLDPFAGSGTTLMAARRAGRRAIGVEISPEFCAVAAARIQRETQALLDLDEINPLTTEPVDERGAQAPLAFSAHRVHSRAGAVASRESGDGPGLEESAP